MALTDTSIKKTKAKPRPYKLSDEKGLYVEVRPTGAKFWRYRYRIPGPTCAGNRLLITVFL